MKITTNATDARMTTSTVVHVCVHSILSSLWP